MAWRLLLEVLSDLELEHRAIGVVGHGCYTASPPCPTSTGCSASTAGPRRWPPGVKRVQPQAAVFTLQGDGDMATEGLHEVLHAAARGERITAIMLNNGVFGDTGGQMTATTVVGQRTKTSLEGRDAGVHGFPIPLADLVANLPGAAYVARGAVNNAGSIAQTKKFLTRAFETQLAGDGFSFVEILTMCPTGMDHSHRRRSGLRGRNLREDIPGEATQIEPLSGDTTEVGFGRRVTHGRGVR